jgi:acetyltransferase-like isoleucine patch superfamily enzyme
MLYKNVKKKIKKFLIEVYAYLKHQYEIDTLNKLKLQFLSIGENASFPVNNIVVNPKYIKIGNNFSALNNFRIEALDSYGGENFSPNIQIGNNVCFNTDCHIGCIKSIRIGNNVLIGSRVLIVDSSHGSTYEIDRSVPPILRKLESKGDVVIEDDVWLCEGVCVLSGVTIGKGAIVAANSVVNKDVPPYTLVGGVPAKIVREL